ncbi:CHAD domain-containing protein [Lignipirellula cremea]|uniref:CHAD domain protein n=1 Tax=Lignipirellula cremea TaxID=2528010 RepID=A0A518DXY9_9BACT|nr:CHAD domain-containing protein [Lignipirellula cremea]QDU96713.1 CHAD domain protein [Lignipirellula cremea]
MSFVFINKESANKGLRRVALAQIDTALVEIHDQELPRETIVHQVRKHCKKLRGLLRLVRPALGKTYAEENAHFREAASQLSQARDAATVLTAFDKLRDHFAQLLEPSALAAIRATLETRRNQIAAAEGDVDQRLAAFEKQMRAARERIGDWKLSEKGFAAFGGGFKKTYQAGREAMQVALDEPTAHNLHEWRKHAKYHWYHVRLLVQMWPKNFKGRRRQLKELADLLGDDHDLANLRGLITPAEAPLEPAHELLFALIDQRRRTLHEAAFALGKELYAASPDKLTRQLKKQYRR